MACRRRLRVRKEDVVEALYRKVVKGVHSDKGGRVADAQRLQVAVERRNRFRASAE